MGYFKHPGGVRLFEVKARESQYPDPCFNPFLVGCASTDRIEAGFRRSRPGTRIVDEHHAAGLSVDEFSGNGGHGNGFWYLGSTKLLTFNNKIILRRKVAWIMMCLGHAAWEHGPWQ